MLVLGAVIAGSAGQQSSIQRGWSGATRLPSPSLLAGEVAPIRGAGATVAGIDLGANTSVSLQARSCRIGALSFSGILVELLGVRLAQDCLLPHYGAFTRQATARRENRRGFVGPPVPCPHARRTLTVQAHGPNCHLE